MRSTTPTNAWLSFSMEPAWEGVGVADDDDEVVDEEVVEWLVVVGVDEVEWVLLVLCVDEVE